ncbi:MAG: MFS transporter [Acetobacteraceae bacterium]
MSETTGAAATPALADAAAVSPARIFWASWSGWMLDGFDSGIYLFVLVPALTELLQIQGIAPTKANVAVYGGYLFTVFMLGWACSMFWGVMADRYGRVRIMCVTILLYSIFTGLCGLANSLVMFGLFRFLAGFGIGGEWAAGTPLLHESVPEKLRVRYAGWLHTATPVGNLLAALASFSVPLIGWRGMFLIGVLPALLSLYLRLQIPEPDKWKRGAQSPAARGGLGVLFRRPNARNTWAAAALMACIIFGLWSSTYWAPTLVLTKLSGEGSPLAYAQRMASFTGVFMNIGSLTACLAMPFIAIAIGKRRLTAVVFFLGAFVMNLIGYLGAATLLDSVLLFLILIPVLGFFTQRRVLPDHHLAARDVPDRAARLRVRLRVQPRADPGGRRAADRGRHDGVHRVLPDRDRFRLRDLPDRPARYRHGAGDRGQAAAGLRFSGAPLRWMLVWGRKAKALPWNRQRAVALWKPLLGKSSAPQGRS